MGKINFKVVFYAKNKLLINYRYILVRIFFFLNLQMFKERDVSCDRKAADIIILKCISNRHRIPMSYYRVQWRALDNTIRKFRGPQGAGNY